MALKLAAAAAIAQADALVALIDAAATAGKVVIYDGARPATPDTAVTTQNPLATFEMGDPAFGGAVDTTGGGQATANAIASVNADASGTASWYRVYDGDDNPIWDGDVTDTAGAGDMKVSSTTVVSGIEVSVVSFTFTQPKA